MTDNARGVPTVRELPVDRPGGAHAPVPLGQLPVWASGWRSRNRCIRGAPIWRVARTDPTVCKGRFSRRTFLLAGARVKCERPTGRGRIGFHAAKSNQMRQTNPSRTPRGRAPSPATPPKTADEAVSPRPASRTRSGLGAIPLRGNADGLAAHSPRQGVEEQRSLRHPRTGQRSHDASSLPPPSGSPCPVRSWAPRQPRPGRFSVLPGRLR